MQIIRRTVLALAATLIAITTSSGAALAAPKPIEPEPAAPTGGNSFSIGSILDGWLQVTSAVLVVAVIVALAVIGLSRLRHRSPSHA